MPTSLRPGTALLFSLFTAGGVFAAAPVLQRSDAIGVELGQAVEYHVVATGGATSFTAQGLPNGVAINGATGVVSGTPGDIGTYHATIVAANADGSASTELAISVVSPSAAPLIYAPLTFDAYYTAQQGGDRFSCQLKATGSPTSYRANDVLPDTWTFNAGTFVGYTTIPGVHVISVSASNANGVGSAAITLRVHPACTEVQQAGGTLKAGDAFVATLQFNRTVTFTGDAPYLECHVADGSTRRLRYLSGNGSTTFQFGYTVTPADPAGPIALYAAIQPAAGGAVSALADQDGLAAGSSLPIAGVYGATATIEVATTAPADPAPAESVATAPTPTGGASSALTSATTPSTDAGGSSAAGDTSAPAPTGSSSTSNTVANDGAAKPVASTSTVATSSGSRLVNLSARADVSAADSAHSFIAGFVIAGSSPKEVLLRAVGPGLTAFGVQNAVSHPVLRVYDATGATVAENRNWNGADVAAATKATGAFALSSGSGDAATVLTLQPGTYSMQVDAEGGAGVALAEVYDVSAAGGTPLLNLSTRGYVGSGEAALTAGFVVSGDKPKRVLIRGIGPALAAYGVSGVLSDPVVELHQGNDVVAANDNWETSENAGTVAPAAGVDIAAAAGATGAFPLAPGSRDAALLVTLPPGSYSAVVNSASGGTGAGMVEVYEVPDSAK
jgi:hypothetical protein